MKRVRRSLLRLGSWLHPHRDEQRLRAEIEEHLALQTADNLRSGLSPVEARRQAILKFGAVEALKDDYRDKRGLPFMETLLQDLRHAIRRLRKAPAFTLTTIFTLALGIGATTSIFTLVHAVLLRSLPVSNPQDLYRLGRETHCCVWGGYSQYGEFSIVSNELYRHLRNNAPGFSELAAFSAGEPLFGVRRTGGLEAAHSYPGEYVSGNYFSMFGISALAGRALTPADDMQGAPPVAVMSYRLWQQKYSADPSIIAATFQIDQKPITIVGITPPGFYGDTLRDSPPDFFLPLAAEPLIQGDSSLLTRPNAHWLDLIGRLRPGATAVQAEAQLRVGLMQWARSHWGDMSASERTNLPQQKLYLSPGGAGITSLREQYERWLHVLITVSGFVLLIVCANVANLLLVRGIERRHQISLSLALGVGTGRLVRQALTESLLLSCLGGAAGLAVAFAGTRLILRYAFSTLPGFTTIPIDPRPSLPVLLFTFAVSLVTGLIFGLAPALMAARVDPIEALRGVNRSTNRSASLPRKTLVVVQAALSLALLTASGLLTGALGNLENQKFGFEQDHRIVLNLDPQLAGYRVGQLPAIHRQIEQAVLAIPGVAAVAMCAYSPQSGGSWNDGVFVDGHAPPGPRDDNMASFERVTEGFFDAIGNPILKGRPITERDVETSVHVAVINEAFARKFFPGEDPIGRHFGRSEPGASRLYEVVGIARDARFLTYNIGEVRPFFFGAATQSDVFPSANNTRGDIPTHYMHDLIVVTRPGAQVSADRLRVAIATVDPNLPVNSIRSLRDQVSAQYSQQRLIARLTSLFGLLSMVLASIGLYGVTAYNAGRRTNEIGLRMALGADRGNVVALVLRGALGLVVIGLCAGLPLTIAAGKFLGNQLYGLNPYDPSVTLLAISALGASALVASIIPAVRASLVSPLTALRAE